MENTDTHLNPILVWGEGWFYHLYNLNVYQFIYGPKFRLNILPSISCTTFCKVGYLGHWCWFALDLKIIDILVLSKNQEIRISERHKSLTIGPMTSNSLRNTEDQIKNGKSKFGTFWPLVQILWVSKSKEQIQKFSQKFNINKN